MTSGRGTLTLIGWAWRGYESYDWWSPREIEFLLVVMKKPGGEHGQDKANTHALTSSISHTHLLGGIPVSTSEANEGEPNFTQELILAALTTFLISTNWTLIP